MSMHSLVVRSDSLGDMVLAGPAIRAVAAHSDRVTVLAGPGGAEVAQLLPGVDDVIVWRTPWIDHDPGPFDPTQLAELWERLPQPRPDRAFILTSDHQSPLPMALALRWAGIDWIGAESLAYPGALLDVRVQPDVVVPEAQRALNVVAAGGCPLPDTDDGRLRVRQHAAEPALPAPYVVLHPGASVPARQWPLHSFQDLAFALNSAGHHVVVTGTVAEKPLTSAVAWAGAGTDLGGCTGLSELIQVLAHAAVVVVGNTGPAHLAAATGTPIVSLFAPTVRADQWGPYRVPHVILGDQQAPCRHSRATICPIPHHPCLASVSVDDVLDAIARLHHQQGEPHENRDDLRTRQSTASVGRSRRRGAERLRG